MGRSAPSPPDHDVASFVREARISAVCSESQLDRLTELVDGHADPDGKMPTWQADSVSEGLLLRNQELSAVSEELREQISTLTRACSLLERERAKYVDLFTGAPNPYVVTDLAGVTQDANIAATALFGLDSASLVGRSLSSFVLPTDSLTYQYLLLEAAEATSGTAPAQTLRVVPPGRAAVVVRARANPVRSVAGRTVALRWMLQRHDPRDVARERSLRETSVAALVVGVLSGLVSRIKGSTQILREAEAREEEERDQALTWIESSAALQQSFLDDLTELAALYDHDRGPTFEEVDLVHCVNVRSTRIAFDDRRAEHDHGGRAGCARPGSRQSGSARSGP